MTHLNKFKDLFNWFPKYMDLDETFGQVQGPRVDFTLYKMRCTTLAEELTCKFDAVLQEQFRM